MWKWNPINRVKEGFDVGTLVFVSQLHQIFRDWWKKVRSTGSFLDKKYTRQNAVLTEEMLDETGARLEHSPCKFLARLAQQAQVSKTTAWRATKNSHLRPYKITQVQVIEECDYGRRTHFWNCFLQAVHGGVLDPKLTFFTDEAWFHLSGYINAQNNRYWSSINPRQCFEAPIHDQKIGVWYAITSTIHIFRKPY
jgi:hypothetical protein